MYFVNKLALLHNIPKSEKGDNSNIYRILPKVNQAMYRYTFDTHCIPKMVILAQAVIQILQPQGPLWVTCQSLKRGIIQSNIHRMFRKVNQVIYILYPNCMPNIIILAQAVLQIFMSKGCFTIQNAKDRHNSAKYRILPKVIRSSTPWIQSVCPIS